MGCSMSTDSGEEEEKRKRSRAIDAKLEEDSRRLRKECKILLLGTWPARDYLTASRMLTDTQGPGKVANQP